MKAGTPTHFKTQRLKRLLKVPAYQAVGILESLWQFVAANAWEGNLGRIPDEDILAAIEYEGDGPALIAALVTCEFLDQDERCRYRVHDWYEHAPEYVRKRIDRKYGKPQEGFSGHWPPLSDVVRQCQPTKTRPSQDQNQAKPGKTPSESMPEPAGESTVEPDREGEFLAAWNSLVDIRKNRGDRLTDSRRRAFRVRCREPSWDWRAAIAKFPLRCFVGDEWKPHLDWFLRPDTVTNILEGKYDWDKRDRGGRTASAQSSSGQCYDPDARAKDPNNGKF